MATCEKLVVAVLCFFKVCAGVCAINIYIYIYTYICIGFRDCCAPGCAPDFCLERNSFDLKVIPHIGLQKKFLNLIRFCVLICFLLFSMQFFIPLKKDAHRFSKEAI